jgi:predicted TPR repeat methyltransferase
MDRMAEARERHARGDWVGAEAAYRAILADEPEHAEATHFLGVLARETERPAEGLALIERSLKLAPGRAQFLYHLGLALEEDGRLEEAAAAYRQAGALAPKNPLPVTNLGLLLEGQQKLEEAIALLEKAVELAPTQDAHFNLARAYEDASRFVEAVLELEKGVAVNRTCGALVRLAAALRRMGQFRDAAAISRAAVEAFGGEVPAWLSLARALDALGQKEETVQAYRRVLELQPGEAEAAFYLRAAEGPPPPAPPAEIVRELYDSFAESFDRHLQQKLGYDGPKQMAEMVGRVLQMPEVGLRPPLDILDAGCGTGLAAAELKALARSLTGIDLSPGMIRQARRRQLYTHLEVADLADYMACHAGSFELIVALEVLIHLGDLAPVFAAARTALRPRGVLALSVEAHDRADQAYLLQASHRYAHSLGYLRQLEAEHGFRERAQRMTTLRQERGVDVRGILLLTQRAE